MKNKYIVFASIGFELITLILVAIYLGEYMVAQKGYPAYLKAILIVLAFVAWFISLISKLRAIEKSKVKAENEKND